jgi:hypothetical protein
MEYARTLEAGGIIGEGYGGGQDGELSGMLFPCRVEPTKLKGRRASFSLGTCRQWHPSVHPPSDCVVFGGVVLPCTIATLCSELCSLQHAGCVYDGSFTACRCTLGAFVCASPTADAAPTCSPHHRATRFPEHTGVVCATHSTMPLSIHQATALL